MNAVRSASEACLVLNLGSATLKAAWYAGFDPQPDRRPVPVRHIDLGLAAGDDADALLSSAIDALAFPGRPAWVGHRFVHGGDAVQARALDAAELARLQDLALLAPLHQPPALALVRAVSQRWPHTRQYAAYDTAWHRGLPENARRLPVPQEWHALGVRRYGFHGLAFASAVRELSRADSEIGAGRIVLAHLGGGASLCAVRAGNSLDTTMAVTPLDGVPMMTRSGSLDPGALLYLLRHGMTVDSLQEGLYRRSGLRGISGETGDVRRLLASAAPSAALALDVFALRIAQAVAAMATRLGGIEHLVFSGGIGARSAPVRSAIVAYLAWLGIGLDEAANLRGSLRIEASASRARVLRVDVDEAAEIALECRQAHSAAG